VGIAFLVRELMMNAMRSYPEDRSTFESERGAQRQKILNPLWSFVAAMGEQPVIAHPYTQASGYPPEANCEEESLPGKEEERSNSAHMKGGHKKGCDPVDVVVDG
jgi:hypothetical protein